MMTIQTHNGPDYCASVVQTISDVRSTQTPSAPVEVLVTVPKDRNVVLSEAENRLQQKAMLQKTSGILVTRYSLNRYRLELSADVPFGETRERTFL